MTFLDSSAVKSQTCNQSKLTMYPPTIPGTSMPSPCPHPTKNKRKGRNYFPNTPQRLHNSWQDMQIIVLKKQKQKQKTNNKKKTSLQTSRHLSSILAGLKIKLKDQGRSRGKVLHHSGFPVISVSL